MSAIQDSSEKIVDNIQEPASGLDEKAAPDGKSYKCVVISLIRHAEVRTHFSWSILLHFLSCLLQCLGNANRSRQWQGDYHPDPLTERGQNQAVSLGKNWADTHIDHLWSSPHLRAHDTAKALSSYNQGHPTIVNDLDLVERRYGDKVHRLMRYDKEAGAEALTGSRYRTLNRRHCPEEGGESMEMVASRAEKVIRLILTKYAVNRSEPPEFFLKKKTTDTPTDLPDGIPHVLIVSHNVFFMELYEKMFSWGSSHSETACHWNNTDW